MGLIQVILLGGVAAAKLGLQNSIIRLWPVYDQDDAGRGAFSSTYFYTGLGARPRVRAPVRGPRHRAAGAPPAAARLAAHHRRAPHPGARPLQLRAELPARPRALARLRPRLRRQQRPRPALRRGAGGLAHARRLAPVGLLPGAARRRGAGGGARAARLVRRHAAPAAAPSTGSSSRRGSGSAPRSSSSSSPRSSSAWGTASSSRSSGASGSSASTPPPSASRGRSRQVYAQPFEMAVVPAYTNLYEKEGAAPARDFLAKVTRLYYLGALPLIAGLWAVREDIIVVFASHKYREAQAVLPILIAGLPRLRRALVRGRRALPRQAVAPVGAHRRRRRAPQHRAQPRPRAALRHRGLGGRHRHRHVPRGGGHGGLRLPGLRRSTCRSRASCSTRPASAGDGVPGDAGEDRRAAGRQLPPAPRPARRAHRRRRGGLRRVRARGRARRARGRSARCCGRLRGR